MKVRCLETQCSSFYKSVYTKNDDSTAVFGIIGFDAEKRWKYIVENVTRDFSLITHILNVLNNNGVSLVHAEDIISDILYERDLSLPENILHESDA